MGWKEEIMHSIQNKMFKLRFKFMKSLKKNWMYSHMNYLPPHSDSPWEKPSRTWGHCDSFTEPSSIPPASRTNLPNGLAWRVWSVRTDALICYGFPLLSEDWRGNKSTAGLSLLFMMYLYVTKPEAMRTQR